jgi:hypothetical protein
VKFKKLRAKIKLWDKSKSKLSVVIENCNIIIAFMDNLEEVRTLYIPKRNFRNIIKEHLLKLLRLQQIYWRQRYTEKLVKFGDDNTKFFHARAA